MRWIGVGVAALALSFAAVGCGGSSDSNSEAAAETVVTETADTSETGTTTDDMSTETTSDDGTSTDTVGDIAGVSEECEELIGASQAYAAAVASASGGDSDAESTAEAFDALAANAPDELKDDFAALAEVMSSYAAAINDLDLKAGEQPSAAQIGALVKLGQSLNTQEAQQASAAIAAWSTENCS